MRRAGNGVLQILWDRRWRLDLVALLQQAAHQWQERFPDFQVNAETLTADLLQFLRQRIQSQLEDDGYASDLVQAVAGESLSDERLLQDPLDVLNRIQLLSQLRDGDRLGAVQAVVQRASRLASKGDLDPTVLQAENVVDPDRFASPSESAMHAVLLRLEPLAVQRAYQELADALVDATPALEAFFDGPDSVMVMAEDADLRQNRLNLLGLLRNQASVLARFDLIQG